jgi:hypothetical protein
MSIRQVILTDYVVTSDRVRGCAKSTITVIPDRALAPAAASAEKSREQPT